MYTKLFQFAVIISVPCSTLGQERVVFHDVPAAPVAAYSLFGKVRQQPEHRVQVYQLPALQDYSGLVLKITPYGTEPDTPFYTDTFTLAAGTGDKNGLLTLQVHPDNIQQSYRNFISHYGMLPVGTYMQETHWMDSRYEIKASDRQLIITDSFMKEDHPVFLQFKKYYSEQTKGKRW